MVCLLFPCLYAWFHISILRTQKKCYLNKRADFLPICFTESEEINLSGIFTIENNFLPFRNFKSCLFRYLYFFQLRPCDVLKIKESSFQNYEHLRAIEDITKETVLWGTASGLKCGKQNIQNKVYSWTAKELQELHTVLHVYCQLIYVHLDLFDPQAGVLNRESSSKWIENRLKILAKSQGKPHQVKTFFFHILYKGTV